MDELKRRHERAVRLPGERQFGFVVGGITSLIAGWLLYASGGASMSGRLLAVIGGLLIVLGTLWPNVLRWPNRAWFHAGLILARITNPIVLTLMYALVIVPIGILMRLARRDPLRLKIDRNTDTYWVRRDSDTAKSSMKDQF